MNLPAKNSGAKLHFAGTVKGTAMAGGKMPKPQLGRPYATFGILVPVPRPSQTFAPGSTTLSAKCHFEPELLHRPVTSYVQAAVLTAALILLAGLRIA